MWACTTFDLTVKFRIMQILLVEYDIGLAAAVIIEVRKRGYQIVHAGSMDEASSAWPECELIVLDLSLLRKFILNK